MKVLIIAGDRWHPMEVVKRGILEFQDLAPDVEYDLNDSWLFFLHSLCPSSKQIRENGCQYKVQCHTYN